MPHTTTDKHELQRAVFIIIKLSSVENLGSQLS